MTIEEAIEEVCAGFTAERAIQLLEAFRVLRESPGPDARYWLGYLLYHHGSSLGVPGDAAVCLQHAVDAMPDDLHARYLLGCARFDAGERAAAEDQFRVVVGSADPHDNAMMETYVLALEMLAVCRLGESDGPSWVDRALDEWERADRELVASEGMEVHARPWQLDHASRGVPLNAAQRDRLARLVARPG
jgi:hypothetical protein